MTGLPVVYFHQDTGETLLNKGGSHTERDHSDSQLQSRDLRPDGWCGQGQETPVSSGIQIREWAPRKSVLGLMPTALFGDPMGCADLIPLVKRGWHHCKRLGRCVNCLAQAAQPMPMSVSHAQPAAEGDAGALPNGLSTN